MSRSLSRLLIILHRKLSACFALQKNISHCLLSLVLIGFSGIAQPEANFKDGFISQHTQTKNLKIELTQTEKDWLTAHPIIRVGVRHNWKPVEFMSEGHQFIGITMDYLADIESLLGIKFKKVPLPNTLSTDDIDMISAVTNPDALRGSSFMKLEPIISFQYAIYTRQNNDSIQSIEDLQGKRVAVFEHAPIIKSLAADVKNIELLRVDIAEEAFEAIKQDNVNAYVGNEVVVDYETHLQALTYIKKVGLTPYHMTVSMAVRDDWPIFYKILEKSFVALGPNNKTILAHWDMSDEHKHGNGLYVLLGALALAFLIAFIRNFLLKRQVRFENEKSQTLIWRQANYDFLTNLPNRTMFQSELEKEVKKTDASGLPLALLFIDLDHFKEVNDHFGHQVGDALLAEAASRICSCTRPSDITSRLGGDEFTVILSELNNPKLAQEVCNRIIQQLELPFQLGDKTVFVTASIGIVLYPDNGQNCEELLRHADIAMYHAKKLGRNGYQNFTNEMKTASVNRLSTIHELGDALKNHEFRVHYQPIIELATGNIVKAEALLRWQHPQKGLLLPNDFIQVAEESNLIFDIGEQVFQQAIADLTIMRQQLIPNFQLSVNVSPKQFFHQQAMIGWINALYMQNLPGNCLTLEITERLLLEPSSTTSRVLKKLYASGTQLSIDDFGTGYSALSYLSKFNIDYIKLDKAFVQNLKTDKSNVILCETIIQMAHKLGIQVIAEGIETKTQQKLLLKLGCEYGQGFLYAKAMPLDDLLKYVASNNTAR